MFFRLSLFLCLLTFNHLYSYSVRTVSTLDMTQKTWDDLRACSLVTFMNAYKDVSPDVFKPQSLEEFCIHVFDTDKKSLEGQDFKCILVEEDTVLIAYVLMHECQPENKIHILHLAVNPLTQSKGMGSLLLDLASQVYPKATHICLSTRDFNTKAIGFYTYLGFYTVGGLPSAATILRPKGVHTVYLEKCVNA